MIDLEEIMASKAGDKNSQIMTYVCLEQPETLEYLNFLKVSQSSNLNGQTIFNFNSEPDEAKSNKKTKKFSFDGIYKRTQKFKHQFAKLIKDVACSALKGQNQTFFIYGTEEPCKDKILFGQSQNPGLFLCILSQIFDTCHQKCMQNEVTLKFSCSLFNKAKFVDIFGGANNKEIQFSKDYLQGGILHNVPEIIVRNIKTGLKLLNILLKQVNDLRQQQYTENMFLTLKLELDCERNRDETTVYCLSKINFIKLANPSINSSLKGVNKNNIWFVNMLNYLQALSISSHSTEAENLKEGDESKIWRSVEKYDDFTLFLKEAIFKSSHKIYGFISITNKITSNECLTALLFSNHLKNCSSSSKYFIININKLTQQRNKLLKNFLTNAKKSQALLELWIEYNTLLENYVSELNYLEFQYSIVIGQACERLTKYIFTEDLEDFYYAKRTNIEKSEDLQNTYYNTLKLKNRILYAQKRIIQKTTDKQDKKQISRFMQLNFSMAYHFLLENIETANNQLKEQLNKLQSQAETKKNEEQKQNNNLISGKFQRAEEFLKLRGKTNNKLLGNCNQRSKNFKQELQQKMKKQSKSIQEGHYRKSAKKQINRSIDNLQLMFKNKNVGMTNKANREK